MANLQRYFVFSESRIYVPYWACNIIKGTLINPFVILFFPLFHVFMPSTQHTRNVAGRTAPLSTSTRKYTIVSMYFGTRKFRAQVRRETARQLIFIALIRLPSACIYSNWLSKISLKRNKFFLHRASVHRRATNSLITSSTRGLTNKNGWYCTMTINNR